jgi:hypothetical protein
VIKRSILLSEPSPLNDLPEGLPRKQVLFYDDAASRRTRRQDRGDTDAGLGLLDVGDGRRRGDGRVIISDAGHVAERTFRLINPVGKRVEPPVDLITLSAAGKEVDLSELHRATAAFAERFERGAATAWEQRGNTPADQVVRVDVPL